jgi:ElaB/YqjD/DUF883 family membrane-anchored ribosome-binding protein
MGCVTERQRIPKNLYSQAVEDQAKRVRREAQKLAEEVEKSLDEAVSRGKEAVGELGVDAQDAARRARSYMASARKSAGEAAESVTTYADDNTALVAVAAFGIGLLVGHLVTRKW